MISGRQAPRPMVIARTDDSFDRLAEARRRLVAHQRSRNAVVSKIEPLARDCCKATGPSCKARRRCSHRKDRKQRPPTVSNGGSRRNLLIKRLIPLGLALAALMPLAAPAQEAYPNKPITLVTPYAPGGGSDIVTRVLADELRRQLGQPVAVQNISGAGGNIGAARVAQAAPDGYTLLLHHVGMATAPALFQNPGFDPVKSFEPVGMFADIPMLLVANKDVPAANMKELLAGSGEKATGDVRLLRPGERHASLRHHVPAARRRQRNHGAISGRRPALADLQAGRVQLLCDGPQAVSGLVRSGAIKAYVLISSRRLESLPDLPTTGELGMQAMDVSLWYGLYVPAGTPRAIIDRLAKALQAANSSAETRGKLNGMEILVFDSKVATPEALREKLGSQVALWGRGFAKPVSP